MRNCRASQEDNFSEISKVRQAPRKLRELTSLESGKHISELPTGTYFFLYSSFFSGQPPKLINDSFYRVDRFPSSVRDIEIHSIEGSGLHIIGFLNESDASRISYLTGTVTHDIILSPVFWGSMTSLVSIPINRIEASSYRTIQISEDEDHLVFDLKVK